MSEGKRRRKGGENKAQGGGEGPGPARSSEPPPTGAPSPDVREDEAFADPRAAALRDRGDTAIASFLTFLFGAPLLLAFAGVLRSAAESWPQYLGGLAEPMEKVLSLADPKPVFAVQALAFLLRSLALVTNRWRKNELLFDALDALYAVTFSLLGFLVGGGLYLAVFRRNGAVLIGSIPLAVLCFVGLVGIDMIELRMTPFLKSPAYRVVVAVLYFLFAAVVLLTNK
jgi:hypothetical protein